MCYDTQLQPHAAGNFKVGNTIEHQIAAMIHCIPDIGFPRALNAVRAMTQAAAASSWLAPSTACPSVCR